MAKKGERYKCEECGMIVTIADPCGCTECDLICCGVPMKPEKTAKVKAKPKPKAKPKTKKK